jgi:predicted nucleic acid-binding protein
MSDGTKPRDISRKLASTWGDKLARLQSSNSTLTPIYIEYVCGQRTAHEVDLARAYLGAFDLADGGKITKQDWVNARRIAERVPRDGLRRQLGDCLIRAICQRRHLEFVTFERRFPHKVP